MTLVVFTIQDDGEGDVDLKVMSEPPLPMKDGEPYFDRATGAHSVALSMLVAVSEGHEPR